jgi:hypothetical protein
VTRFFFGTFNHEKRFDLAAAQELLRLKRCARIKFSLDGLPRLINVVTGGGISAGCRLAFPMNMRYKKTGTKTYRWGPENG